MSASMVDQTNLIKKYRGVGDRLTKACSTPPAEDSRSRAPMRPRAACGCPRARVRGPRRCCCAPAARPRSSNRAEMSVRPRRGGFGLRSMPVGSQGRRPRHDSLSAAPRRRHGSGLRGLRYDGQGRWLQHDGPYATGASVTRSGSTRGASGRRDGRTGSVSSRVAGACCARGQRRRNPGRASLRVSGAGCWSGGSPSGGGRDEQLPTWIQIR